MYMKCVIYITFVYTYIVLSCLFALGVNVSNYLVLGKTSPLTYQAPNRLLICILYSMHIPHYTTILIAILHTLYNLCVSFNMFICIYSTYLYTYIIFRILIIMYMRIVFRF